MIVIGRKSRFNIAHDIFPGGISTLYKSSLAYTQQSDNIHYIKVKDRFDGNISSELLTLDEVTRECLEKVFQISEKDII